MCSHDFLKEDLLSDEEIINEDDGEDDSILFNGTILDPGFSEFQLKYYLKHSVQLANIFQKIDLLAVEIDINIVNNLCQIFDFNQDYYQILVIKKSIFKFF